MAVFLKHMEQVSSVEQYQRLPVCEGVSVRSVVGRGDENSFIRSLIHYSAVEIPYCPNADGVSIPLRLDDDLSASDRIGIERYGVYTTVAACLSDFHLTSG